LLPLVGGHFKHFDKGFNLEQILLMVFVVKFCFGNRFWFVDLFPIPITEDFSDAFNIFAQGFNI
jgi:hypothetical protein